MQKSFGTLSAALLLAFAPLAQAANVGLGFSYYHTSTLGSSLSARGDTVSILNSFDADALAGLDAYIVDGNSYFDAAALDAFVLGGGTLIQLPWSFTQRAFTADTTVFGKRTDPVYAEANQAITTVSGSALLDGVTLPAAGTATIGYEQGNVFADGATQVLQWEDGTALLGYRQYGAGAIVAFNVNLLLDDASPLDAAWSNQIVYNAIDGAALPVPEPKPWGLLAAGLGVLALSSGARARQRETQKLG